VVTPTTTEQLKDMIKESINKDLFDMFIIDSIAGLSSTFELQLKEEDRGIGIFSNSITRLAKTIGPMLRIYNKFMFTTNQVRIKVNNWRVTEQPPGGNALKHFSSLRIKAAILEKTLKSITAGFVINQKYQLQDYLEVIE
ncbi:MAG: hypothetical protein ACP5JE_03285, partial [Thermoplasmata archaeon]